MCGIAGFWQDPQGTGRRPGEIAEAMATRIAHRGPDDDGCFADPSGLELGFRRLAIFDTSIAGHQPMHSASERFVLVFNGEVYNHVELRRDLEREGARFRSGSDTEVILAGVEAWGIPATLRRCRGMWGMGIWDRRERRLTLARDRLGIKPLYVYRASGVTAFASDIRCFFEIPGATLTVDRPAVASFLSLLSVPAPFSIFEEVTKVWPGTYVTVGGPGSEPVVDTYWSLEDVARRGIGDRLVGSDDELTELVAEEIRTAVSLRLRADVPVGAFLSGGIDSSTVVAVAQSLRGTPLKTFTVAFEDPRFDESLAARDVSSRLGTEHTEVVATEADLLRVAQRLPEVFDEPFADPSQLPTQIISEVARRSVTVSLSGDGGDEVFAGYNRYLRGAPLVALAGRGSAVGRRALAAALGAFPAASVEGRSFGRRILERFGASEQHPLAARLRKLRGVISAESPPEGYLALLSANPDVASLVATHPSPLASVRRAFELEEVSIRRRMLLADQGGYLQDDLLTKLDRNSMSVALEARVPLLDHRLVELSWRLPDEMLVRDGKGKQVLRRVLSRYLPEELIDRPKMGFSVPVGAWLRGPLRPWAAELVSPDSVRSVGILDARGSERMWERFLSGGSVNPLAVWAVLQLQDWCRRWGVGS